MAFGGREGKFSFKKRGDFFSYSFSVFFPSPKKRRKRRRRTTACISTHSTPTNFNLARRVRAGVGRQREPLVLLLGRDEAPRLGGRPGPVLLPLLGDGPPGHVDLGRHLDQDRLDVDQLRVDLRAHRLDLDQVRRGVDQRRRGRGADDRDADRLGADADQLRRCVGAGCADTRDARPPLDLAERRLEQVDLGHRVDGRGDELAFPGRGEITRRVEDLLGRRRAGGRGDRCGLGDALQHRVAELQVGRGRGQSVGQRHRGDRVDGGPQPVEALVLRQRGLRQVEQVLVGLERLVLPRRVDVGGLDVGGREGGAVLGDLIDLWFDG